MCQESLYKFYRLTLEVVRGKITIDEYMQDYQDKERFLDCCRVCQRFRKQWVCPPFDYDVDDVLHQYKWMEVIGVKALMDDELRHAPYDDRSQYIISYKIMDRVRQAIDPLLLKRESSGARAFYAGSCQLCKDGFCTRPMNKPCRYPRLARPSLESFGFDIVKTTQQLLGLDLLWSKDHVLPPYFALVSGLMMNEEPSLDIELFDPEKQITLYM